MKAFFGSVAGLLIFTSIANAQMGGGFRDRPMQTYPRSQSQMQVAASLYGDGWNALSPEQKLGTVIESFWVFGKVSGTNCPPDSQGQKTACLTGLGYKLTVSYPAECQIQLTEKEPTPTNGPTTWDNKPSQVYVIGRTLKFSMKGIDPSLIYKTSDARFEIFFNATDPANVEKSVLYSSDPDKWVSIPKPPMMSDIQAQGTEDEKLNQLVQTRTLWLQKLFEQFGKTDLPYFRYDQYFADGLLNDPASLRRVMEKRADYFLKLSTPNLTQAMHAFATDGRDVSNERFVDAVKSIIQRCR